MFISLVFQGKIEPGDILDEIYGECLKGVRRGQIKSLLKQNQGWPVYLSVVKVSMK